MTLDTASHDPPPPAPRRLHIDLSDLDEAFQNASPEARYFLDLETGRVILLTEDTRVEYEQLCESIGEVEEAEWETAFESALTAIRDWQRELVRDADRVETGLSERIVQIPPANSRDGYRDMKAFIETVTNQPLAEQLGRAIEGRGAFRYFKDVLLDHAAERERWFAFRDARQRERVLEWLADEGIEPVTSAGK